MLRRSPPQREDKIGEDDFQNTDDAVEMTKDGGSAEGAPGENEASGENEAPGENETPGENESAVSVQEEGDGTENGTPGEDETTAPVQEKNGGSKDSGTAVPSDAAAGIGGLDDIVGVDAYPDKNASSLQLPALPTILLSGALLLCAAAAGFAAGRRARKRAIDQVPHTEVMGTRKKEEATPRVIAGTGDPSRQPDGKCAFRLDMGKLHHIGRRQSQQDSLGIAPFPDGMLAIVADGMGGLSNGDMVSQKIVTTMLGDCANQSAAQLSGRLTHLVSHVSAEVNQMLGGGTQYVSGSTLIAVLAEPKQFQWISVGDSRIYLHRGGGLLQINREHVYEAELLEHAVNREISFQEAHTHAKRKNVTSFIGMGSLKHIDFCLRPVPFQRGDKLLLTTDGVFNTLSDTEISAILAASGDAPQAAQALEQAVLEKGSPHQDNFSAILLFCQ